MSPEERDLLASLDLSLRLPGVQAAINVIVSRVAQELARRDGAVMAWEPIPLAIYDGSLPVTILSSWVFILRGASATGAERHPNSHQRVVSFVGKGDLQTGGPGRWESHVLVSDDDAALEQRWASIPPNVWHQAVVRDGDWVVVSFHTVPAYELIEERPGPDDDGPTRQRLYVSSDERSTR